MGFQQFISLLVRGWWIVLLATLVTVGSTAFFVSRQAPEYRASTTVELIPAAQLEANGVVNVYSLLDKRNISNTLARKAEGSSMAQLVASKLNIDASVVRHADISAIVLPDSNIIEISASSSNPDLAASIANTIADEMLGQTPTKILDVEAIDRASTPSSPIAPQPSRLIMLALLSGLVLGVILVLLENVVRNPSGPSSSDGFGGGRREPGVAFGSGAVNAFTEKQ